MIISDEDARKQASNKSHSDGLAYSSMTDAGYSRSRSRFSPEAYKWVREYLKLRDCNGGPAKCKLCDKVESEYRILVHHLNGDDRCNEPWNVEFRCDSHHTKGMWDLRKARLESKIPRNDGSKSAGMPYTLEVERERVAPVRQGLRDDLADERLAFALAMGETKSLEIKLNRKYRPRFRALVKERLLSQGSKGYLTIDYCKNGLAELIGCSQDACEDYLKQMTSDEGELYEDELNGTRIVRFKESYYTKQDAELQAAIKIMTPKNVRSLDEFTKKEATQV